MLKPGCAVLIALVMAGAAWAQGFGIGAGLDDLRQLGLAAAPAPPPAAAIRNQQLIVLDHFQLNLN